MAVIIISPVLASASPAAKISKPAAQAQKKKKKSRLQYCSVCRLSRQQHIKQSAQHQAADSSHSLCTNTN
jgi:hypothetical protein